MKKGNKEKVGRERRKSVVMMGQHIVRGKAGKRN